MAVDKSYDMAFLNKISGGDESFILEMVNTFRDVGPEYSLKALALLNDSKYEQLGKETHKVIPGVTFLGAKNLEADLMVIEEYCKKLQNLGELPVLVTRVQSKIAVLIQEFIQDFNLEA